MQKKHKTWILQLFLLVLTFFTTTLAGAEWIFGRTLLLPGLGEWFTWEHFQRGLHFSIPFLGILTVHEFGHYIAARLYKVKVSLPYYLPFFLGFANSIGTFGAFIKIKSRLVSSKQIFDIGIAGPLAGFVAAMILLWYGFTNLPPMEYIFEIHPEYAQYGEDYEKYVYDREHLTRDIDYEGEIPLISVGSNLIFEFFTRFVAPDPSLVPNRFELMHYPYLFAGYLALLFTALNLLPIGQLDGGHILYGLIGGRRHYLYAPWLFFAFVVFAGLGIFQNNPFGNAFEDTGSFVTFSVIYLPFLYLLFSRLHAPTQVKFMNAFIVFLLQLVVELLIHDVNVSSGWFVFAFVVGRFLGVYHPPALIEQPLSPKRKILGWFALIVFILCFTPRMFIIEMV
ncbi:site-2 protease family protein [Cytophagaceae bacterium ABcell3]|nr:site-2 protease family protein [Cytophagaceae bacterium ABcell3]